MGDALAILEISLMAGKSAWHNQGHSFILIFFDRMDTLIIALTFQSAKTLSISFFKSPPFLVHGSTAGDLG
jgi:hypothetical protein